MQNVEIQNVLVTGATGGIGRALVHELSQGSYRLVVTGENEERLRDLAGAFPVVKSIAGNLTVPGQAARVVADATEALGRLDAVVHLAGVGLLGPTLEVSDADFSRVTNVNLRATFLVAQESVRQMLANKRGLFITVPGILGKAPMRNAAVYAAGKYGVTGMIKSMQLEFQRQGIRFALLHFGGVDTAFWDAIPMKVEREKMIPPETAAEVIAGLLKLPSHLVPGELTLQPESHLL